MVRKGQVVAVVVIGVDPHKGSRTAVALGADEVPLGQVRVRASAAQAQRLLAWAQAPSARRLRSDLDSTPLTMTGGS